MKLLFSLMFLAVNSYAGVPFWKAPDTSTSTAYGTGYLSGNLKVYPATTTAAASPSIWLNGPSAQATVRSGANVSTISATSIESPSFVGALTGAASLNVLKTGDNMSGQLTNTSSVTITGNGGKYGLSVSSGVSLAGLIYTNNGKVGISSEYPSESLTLAGNAAILSTGKLCYAGDCTNYYSQFVDSSTGVINSSYYGHIIKGDTGKGLRIANDGKVGVGTHSPSTLFEVAGAGSLASIKINSNSSADNAPSLLFNSAYNQANERNWRLMTSGSALGSLDFLVSASSGAAANTRTMTITKDGYVGIGSAITPTHPLEVTGTVNATAFEGDGSALTGLPGGGDVLYAASGTFTGAPTFASYATFQSEIKTSTFTKSSLSGWTYLTNGIILQWGYIESTQDTEQTFNFSRTFPVDIASVSLTRYEPAGGGNSIMSVKSFSTSGFVIDRDDAVWDGTFYFFYTSIGW